ncbi:hypothetical protein DFH29DRAFT_222357 [Suillus ampliporus]|nr:hypothetical protein DFH29DRAFT_222357 [Suillus ampliporus]
MMHRALLVSDVLLEIFAYVNQILDPSSAGDASQSRKSLTALARTCKAFHEPAMDLLWADIDQLEPLLGCVTRLHPLIYRRGQKYSWFSRSIKPLSEREARQFLRHSARVLSLRISFDRHLHLLSAIPIETCIFPRLLSLSTGTSLRSTKYLHLFLSPTLRRCHLQVIHPALKCIATCYTALEDLYIKPSPYSADDLSPLSDSVRLCTRLVTLCCPPLDWEAWKHLSNLPTLLRVMIHEPRRAPDWSLEQDIVNFSPFLNVTTLSFRLKSAASIITVMQHTEFPSLKEFEMDVAVLSSAEAEQLFRALSQCKACQTLEQIILSCGDGPRDLPGTTITQFFCFTQLRTLQLNFLCSYIYLDDDLLLEAVSTWPHIRSLKIGDPHSCAVTFRGLFTALPLCPHLHTLRVPIDTANINIDPNVTPLQHTSLKALDLLATSHIADAKYVARIIFSMFPLVDRVSEFMDRWHGVNGHLTSLRASALLGGHVAGRRSNTQV